MWICMNLAAAPYHVPFNELWNTRLVIDSNCISAFVIDRRKGRGEVFQPSVLFPNKRDRVSAIRATGAIKGSNYERVGQSGNMSD